MDVDTLLTTTRSARKMLDLDAPVDLDVVRTCLRIGLQAPNGTNQQSWRWIAVADESRRATIAALYRDAYLAIAESNIIKTLAPNFDIQRSDVQTFGLYDAQSVMHYIPFTFTKTSTSFRF